MRWSAVHPATARHGPDRKEVGRRDEEDSEELYGGPADKKETAHGAMIPTLSVVTYEGTAPAARAQFEALPFCCHAPRCVARIENKRPAFAGPSLMELGGLEPPTSWVRSRRSPS